MVTALIDSDRTGRHSHHIDRVQAIVEGRAPPRGAPAPDVSMSWHRCLNAYGLDPASGESPRILTSGELRDHRDPLAPLVHSAAGELDRLYSIVGQARYIVLLCNREGVAIDYRANAADISQFSKWGIYLGGVWSEEVEGTNAIGTSIAEQRPVTIHRSQHFRARHITLSCSSAPILDADGRVVAVLDVSSFDAALSDRSHALAGVLVKASARAIAEQVDQNQKGKAWQAQRSYSRGGLPPGAVKRVRDYIEAHLEDRPSLEQLAATAGLSVFHFARAFKQSQGMTPHSYVLHRRVARAQELLSATDLSLSQIALVSGFADQSHFTRHFRQRIGVPPSSFRRSQR